MAGNGTALLHSKAVGAGDGGGARPFQILKDQLTLSQIGGRLRKLVIEGMAAIKLGSLEKTIVASLFHSGLHSGTIFF